jgi:hypothetical protein
MKKNISETKKLPIRYSIRTLYLSTLIIILMVIIVSLIGIMYQRDLYPSDSLKNAFVPSDIVNLIAGLPLLLVSMMLVKRGKLIGLLCWPGAVLYILYIYFPYIIGVPFNNLFLPYLILISLCIYTLIGIIVCIDSNEVTRILTDAIPTKISGGILMGLAALIVLREVVLIINALINKTQIDTQELALWIHDVTIMSPVIFIGGLFLWKKHPLGYTVGAGLLITYGILSLELIPLLAIQAHLKNTYLELSTIITVGIMGIICLIPFWYFVRGSKNMNITD